jgi:hypothetical protein
MALINYTGYKGYTLIARERAEGWVVEIVSGAPEQKLQTTAWSGLPDAIGEAHHLVDRLHGTHDALQLAAVPRSRAGSW